VPNAERYAANRESGIEYSRQWRLDNPAWNTFTKARSRVMSRYNLDKQQAEVALISKMGDFCEACGRFAKMDIDHDHKTGEARGLLCRRCNIIAGALEDRRCGKVGEYLERPRGS